MIANLNFIRNCRRTNARGIYEDYIISGNRISIKTLDLNADFSAIRMQLDELVTAFFEMYPRDAFV